MLATFTLQHPAFLMSKYKLTFIAVHTPLISIQVAMDLTRYCPFQTKKFKLIGRITRNPLFAYAVALSTLFQPSASVLNTLKIPLTMNSSESDKVTRLRLIARGGSTRTYNMIIILSFVNHGALKRAVFA